MEETTPEVTPEVAPELAPEPAPEPAARPKRQRRQQNGGDSAGDPVRAFEQAQADVDAAEQALARARARLAEAAQARYAADFPPIPDGVEVPLHEQRARSAALGRMLRQTQGRGPNPRRARRVRPMLGRGK